MSLMRDMVFSVLYTGDEHLIRDMVWRSAQRLGAEWELDAVRKASLQRLRVLFFLLLDRDITLKNKILDGFQELCIQPLEARKAMGFFTNLKNEVIMPYLIDEQKTDDDFMRAVTDLYLVS